MVTQASGSSVHDLPPDLLAQVLQHLELQQRLQCCALVCSKWRQAVNIATPIVLAANNSKQCLDSLSGWLSSNRHISLVQSIRVKHKTWPVGASTLQLPFKRLTALKYLRLPCCDLLAALDRESASPAAYTAAPSTGAAATTQISCLGTLTALSKLRLSNTRLSLSELGSCTGLQRLALYHVCHITAAENSKVAVTEETWQQLALALPQLTQLTYLHLRQSVDDHGLGDVINTLCFSSLRRLQDLRLGPPKSTAVDISSVPSSLTSLQLCHEDRPNLSIQPSGLQAPQLQRLHLVHAWNPAILHDLTTLTWLCIKYVKIKTANGVKELLAGLQHLKQLRHLDLEQCWPELHSRSHPRSAAYAALTASSHLTLLDVRECLLPAEAFEHMFAATDALKHLKVLALPASPIKSEGALQRLISCCPAVNKLLMLMDRMMVTDGVRMQGLSALTQLSALTNLCFEAALDDDALRSIAACDKLKVLRLDASDDGDTITADELLHLSQLTGLTRLELIVLVEDHEAFFDQQILVSNTSPPDVHLQLQQLISGTSVSSMPQHNDDSTDCCDFDDDTEFEPVSQDPFEDLYGDDMTGDEGDGDQSDDGSDDGPDDDASDADTDDVPDDQTDDDE